MTTNTSTSVSKNLNSIQIDQMNFNKVFQAEGNIFGKL